MKINEKAKSKSQQQLMGMVHAYKKGELKNPPKKIKDIADSISDKEAEKYAKTKQKDLPDEVSEQNIRSMSFKDYFDCTTPRYLNEEND